MTPTPDQILRLLALPAEVREMLCAQGGPGWYVADVYPRPTMELRLMPPRIVEGEAWCPCDSDAWMRAATPDGGMWWISSEGCEIVDFRGHPVIEAPSPIECFLRRYTP